MRARAAPLLVVVLDLGVLACGGPGIGFGNKKTGGDAGDAPEAPFPVRLTAEQSRGRAVYGTACASCHGTDGRGDTVAVAGSADSLPDLSAQRYASLDSAELAARFETAHGDKLRTVVPQGDVRAVLQYLPVLSYPPDAPGSAIVGRRLYQRYCSSCHGVNGDGNGPAAQLLDTKPANFTVDSLVTARNFDALARVTRDGPGHPHVSSMPAWGLFFNKRMLDDVAAYLPTFLSGTKTTPRSSGPPPT
jgi:mono/diheme cytochrome c family protein